VLQTIRDIAVIILAFESIVVGIGVLLLIWQAWKLVGLVRHHFDRLTGSAGDVLESVKGVAETTAETARTAQGTVGFISDRAARPLIELYSAVSGASRFAEAVFQRRRNGATGGNR